MNCEGKHFLRYNLNYKVDDVKKKMLGGNFEGEGICNNPPLILSHHLNGQTIGFPWTRMSLTAAPLVLGNSPCLISQVKKHNKLLMYEHFS